MAIQVHCPCGKVLRVPDESRGKKVRCPSCKAISAVEEPAPPPGEEEAVELVATELPPEEEAPPPRRRRPVAEDDNPDEKPAPKKSRGLLLLGLGCLGFVLLGCLGGGGLVVVLILNAPSNPRPKQAKTVQQRLAGTWEVDREASIAIDDYARHFSALVYTFHEDNSYDVSDPRAQSRSTYVYEVRDSEKDSARLDVFTRDNYAKRVNPKLMTVHFVGDDTLRVDVPAKFVLHRKGSKPPPQTDKDKDKDKQPKLSTDVKGVVLAELTGHNKPVRALTVSPDGKSLASASEDGLIKVWDLDDKKEKHSITGVRGPVRALVFSRDAKLLWSGAGDSFPDWGEICTHDAVAGKQKGEVIKREFAPSGLALADTGKRLVWGEGKSVVVWDPTASRQELRLTLDAEAIDTSLLPSGHRVAVGAGQEVSVLSVSRSPKAKVNKFQPKAQGAALKRVALSEDGNFVAAGAIDKGVGLWDVKENTFHVLEGPNFMISGLAFSRDNVLLAASVSTEGIWVWRPWAAKKLAQWKTHAEEGFMPTCLVFTPDGKRLITGGHDGKIRVWDVEGLISTK